MSGAEVVVIGGGVIGCATARLLAMQGVAVTVVERAEAAMEASWAAAGMLSPLAEAHRPDPFLTLLLAAADRFPALAEHLLIETGIDVGYRSDGTLFLAIEDSDEELLEDRWRWQSAAGLAVDRLTAEETLALEPAAAPRTRWALRYPDDHQVDSRDLSRALWRAAEAAGARFVIGRSVAGIERQGARVTGLELEDGETLAAEAVVIAAGSWAGQLAGLPRPLPVEPIHGQLIALAAADLQLRHVVDTPRIYVVPRADGRIIAGATVERTGFEKAVTDRGIAALLAGATEAIPELAGRPILESWSGLRPGTPDEHPIIGRDPEAGNLIYATGHFRNGILLAPITAEAVAALLTGGRPLPETEGFGIERFASEDG